MMSDVAASCICVCVVSGAGRYNEIFIILISDFSQEMYVLPDDDMQCAIATCRSSGSV
jgi:hypothetical protein